ncbi:MAG TPA: hypothetical protein VNO43_18850, partial [Candidatus Eisenbacteria bacterium]|nr:hypothetical protein [Candidatus Eisenbacteria bacterium]
MERLLLDLTAALYLLAGAGFIFYLLVRNDASRAPAWVLLSGFSCHTAALAVYFFREGYPAVTAL